MNVTVWGEGFYEWETVPEDERPWQIERVMTEARVIYPDDLQAALAAGLVEQLGPDVTVRTAALDDTDYGLSDEILDSTDVLVWWGHVKHERVPDEVVERVWKRIVVGGMGLIMLHAGASAKIFLRLMGSSCGMSHLRVSDDWEAIWTMSPNHPIAEGVPSVFVLPEEEVYAEHFDIPAPDDVVFVSTFRGGEFFRSGCTWTRGNGRIFYFRAGHETHPTFHHPEVKRLLANATKWAANPPKRIDMWSLLNQGVKPDPIEEHLYPEGWFLKQ